MGSEEDLRDLYNYFFGASRVKGILEENRLALRGEKELDALIESQRERDRDACQICKDQGLFNKKLGFPGRQDFPGWKGDLKNKKIIIVGSEISPKSQKEIHICYGLGWKKKLEGTLFRNLGIVFDEEQLIENSYVTDIAKCLSMKKLISKENCLDIFKREIDYLKSYLGDPLMIFQGFSNVEKINEIHTQKYGKDLITIHKTFRIFLKETIISFKIEEPQDESQVIVLSEEMNVELDKESSMRSLLQIGYYNLSGGKIPVCVFPHTSKRITIHWAIIKTIKTKIQEMIKDFSDWKYDKFRK